MDRRSRRFSVEKRKKAPVPGPSARWHSAHPGRWRRSIEVNIGGAIDNALRKLIHQAGCDF
jgi:hypothetical protein